MKEKIRKELVELSDKKYREFHSGLCLNTKNILGVRVPVLRSYVKKLLEIYNAEELLENIGNEYYEEVMIKGMIICTLTDFKEVLYYIDKFVPLIDNWAICDTFCSGLKITNKNKEEMWKYLSKYLKSNKEFELRFAIVMILDYYINDNYITEIYKICDNIQNKDYYVQMAIAWLLSICLIKYYDETVKYLHECNIDKFTFNKTIQKAIESYRIDQSKKEELKKMKK